MDGSLQLLLARAAAVAGLLSLFGTLAFRDFVMPRALRGAAPEVETAAGPRLRQLAQGSLLAAVLALLLWLVLQAADMADAGSVAQALAAVPIVAGDTWFGRLVLLQLLALLATAGLRRRRWGALASAGLALALQAGHGHAASMIGSPGEGGTGLLLAAGVLHLLGSGGWLGGLAPLLLVVRAAPARVGAMAARWFTPLGKLCVVAVAASAAVQGWVLVGSIPGLVGTAYGDVALVKLAGFGVLLGFALVNRYRFAPALLRGDPLPARRLLIRSILLQTGCGLAVVAAAVVLGSLPPAMHVRPEWPFPLRFTLDTVNEDREFRLEVLGAVLALLGAAALLGVAMLVRRRLRWTAVAAALGIAWLAVPHLDLLFVPATATSFYHSPTGFASGAIMAGAALYPTQCAACHGAQGRGDGPAAAGLPVPPADLTAAHLWMHPDGEMFGWLLHGIEAPRGGMAMPGFPGLTDPQRWALIDWVRAHNAGLAFQAAGAWPQPLQAPGFQADCDGGRTESLADLRGGFVRVVAGVAPSAPGITTVLATDDPAAQPAPGVCVTRDRDVPPAYAAVTGPAPQLPPGMQVLIDGNGWLRAVQPGGWDARALAAAVREFAAQPVAATTGDAHAGM